MRFFKKFRKYINRKFNWQIIASFTVFLILGIIVLIWVCFLEKYVSVENFKILKWSIPKDIVINVLSQFSGTFFVIALLVITVERLFKIFLKRDIEIYTHQVGEHVHDAIFGTFTPPEILSEIKHQIFLSAFIYRDYNAEYITEEVFSKGEEECIAFSSEVVFDIENISELNREFKGILEYTNSEFEGKPIPIKHEKLEIRYRNKTLLSLSEEECRRRVVKDKTVKGKYLLPYEVEIPGEDKVELRVNRVVYFKSNNDIIDIFLKRPTINMNIKIVFPSADYRLAYSPYMPEMKNLILMSSKHHGKEINLNYRGGILPYQGVKIEWKKGKS